MRVETQGKLRHTAWTLAKGYTQGAHASTSIHLHGIDALLDGEMELMVLGAQHVGHLTAFSIEGSGFRV